MKQIGLCAVALGVALSGCSVVQHAIDATTKATGNRGSIISDDDRLREKKLAPYIVCLNRVDTQLRTAAKDYLQHALPGPPGAYPAPFQPPSPFQIDPQAIDQRHSSYCIDRINASIAAAPKVDELDSVGRVYSAQLARLLPTIAAANSYYAQKDYKDDGFAKARAMRKTLAAGFNQLFADSDRIRAVAERENVLLKQHELDGIEKNEGRNLRWHSLSVMIAARTLFNAANTAHPSSKAIAGPLAAYSSVYSDAKAYSDAHPKEAIMSDGSISAAADGGWTQIKSSAERYLSSVKEFDRALKAKPGSEDLQRAGQEFVDGFNQLVGDYNLAVGFSSPPQ